MIKKVEYIQKCLDSGTPSKAKSSVKQADNYSEKLSPEFQQTQDTLDLKKRLDDQDKVVVEKETNLQASIENTNALLMQKSTYTSIIRPYLRLYYMLNAGETKDIGTYSISDIEKRDKQLHEFKAFKPKFRETIPVVIEQSPTYTYERASVEAILDALKTPTPTGWISSKPSTRKAWINCSTIWMPMPRSIKKGTAVSDYMMAELYGERAKNNFHAFETIEQSSKATGFPLPQDKVKKLADLKPKMRKILESEAEKHTWKSEKKSKYSYRNGRLEDVLEKYIEQDRSKQDYAPGASCTHGSIYAPIKDLEVLIPICPDL